MSVIAKMLARAEARKRCPHCREDAVLDLLDIYPEDRSFQWTVCCERVERELHALQNDPKALAAVLNALGWAAYTGERARSVYSTDGGHLEVDQRLELCEVNWAEARTFIAEHHRHNEAPVGWRFGFGVKNWHSLVAVATVGRPIARKICADSVAEITRVCTDLTLHTALTHNACSMLYGACAREACRQQFERVITYTLFHESGVSLRAAGFRAVHVTPDQAWNRPSRSRAKRTPEGPKVRWERTFPENAGLRASRSHGAGRPQQLSIFPSSATAPVHIAGKR